MATMKCVCEYAPEHEIFTDEKIDDLFKKGLPIYFDTNALLEFYGIPTRRREEMFGDLQGIADRIYLPSQAIRELLKNKDSQGLSKLARTHARLKEIQGLTTQLTTRLRALPPTLYPEKATEEESEAVSKVIDSLSAAMETLTTEADHAWGPSIDVGAIRTGRAEDPVIEAIFNCIREDHLLPKLSHEDLLRRSEEYLQRVRMDPPLGPGATDIEKPKIDGVQTGSGDYVMWSEILEHCASLNGESAGFIFVTQEKKKDFWVESRSGKDSEGLRKLDPRLQLEAIRKTGGPAILIDRTQLWRLLQATTGRDLSRFESNLPAWSHAAYLQLLERLNSEGNERQANVIQRAARDGGFASRAAIGQALGWGDTDGTLQRFSMPALRIQQGLVDEGTLSPASQKAMEAFYQGPGKLHGYSVPPEFVTFEADAESES